MIEARHNDIEADDAPATEASTTDELLREPLSSLGVELTRISAEIQSIHSGFQAQLQQALAEVQANMESRYREQLAQALADMQRQFDAEMAEKLAYITKTQEEILRAREQLDGVSREIHEMIDDPAVELSRVMRKKTEQSELRAYLNGLLFSINEK